MDYKRKIYSQQLGYSDRMILLKGEESFPKIVLDKIDGKILDIGCGAGLLTNWLLIKKPKLEIVGVDVSSSAIEIAKRNIPDAKFMTGNACKLPLKNGIFDVVIICQVLEHLKTPQKAIGEARRVLKKGGLIYVTVPMEGEKWVIKAPKKLSEKYFGHQQRFSKAGIFRLLSDNGFEIKTYFYKGFVIQGFVNYLLLSVLNFFNMPAEYSPQQELSTSKKNPLLTKALQLFRKIIFYLIIFETKISFKVFPGQSIYILAKKNEK